MEEPFGDEIADGRLVKPPGLLEETEKSGNPKESRFMGEDSLSRISDLIGYVRYIPGYPSFDNGDLIGILIVIKLVINHLVMEY